MDYDAERVERLAGEALDEMSLRPFGRVLVKPNCVASGEMFPHAYTRPEFLEGVLRALKSRSDHHVEELAVGERCGITVPTRYSFKEAGYYSMTKRVGGIEMYHFEESPQVEIPLYHDGRLRDSFFTPEPVARADFFVNCPKFKAHPWTTVTFSMKNYIGIQDDRHRLLDHDWALDRKVADLQYIVQPQFIAIDAIIAGEGRMLTPLPRKLGLAIFGNNQLAFDAVCCHIIGVDPMTVDHLRYAYERGFGPISLDEIDVRGDVSLEEARERAQGFNVGLIRVEDYFEDSNINAYAGPPPSEGASDYCWGGCPGAMEEAIEILRVFDTMTDEKLPPVHIVFGAYDGEIPARDGEKVIFMGDCASWRGCVRGRDIDVASSYLDRSHFSPHEVKHQDVFKKMIDVEMKFWATRKADYFKVKGCPVSVAESVLVLVKLGHLNNPLLDPKTAIPFTSCYLSWRTRQAIKHLFGASYQVAGPTRRGKARPKQNLPASGTSAPLER